MKAGIEAEELLRARWRRARASMHLVDTGDEKFAQDPLTRGLDAVRMRLVILPADPEGRELALDESVWEWWTGLLKLPGAGSLQWGAYKRMTQGAAVRYQEANDHRWERYVAVYTHGGMEVAVGESITWASGSGFGEEPRRAFRLVQMSGVIWSGLETYATVLEKAPVTGPWEVTLAIAGTANSLLGNVGAGWADVDSYEGRRMVCSDENILATWRIDAWPAGEDVREWAFRIASTIDNAWGYGERRFIACRGDLVGKFDLSRFRI